MKRPTLSATFRAATATLLTASLLIGTFAFTGCAKKGYQKNKDLDTKEEVSLIVSGARPDYKAMELLTNKFHELYPNCNIKYEYIQDYNNNLPSRLASDTDKVDVFITNNVQADSPFLENSVDFFAYKDKVDLSGTMQGMIDNYTFIDNDSSEADRLYGIPVGGEIRGMFVNKTLLSSLGIEVPQTRTEFLDACRKISDAGYIPLQGNPGSFGNHLMYPYICHMIVDSENAEEVHDMINNADEGSAEFFRDALEFEYSLVENNYYNYKYVETELSSFLTLEFDVYAKDFLGIKDNGSGYEKTDDIGSVAFMPAQNSVQNYVEKNKEDYHSDIEYEFVLSPVTEDGGCAYLSPSSGIAVNKNSDNLDWALEFINFMFYRDNNIEFAENDNLIPDIADAVDYVSEKFDIPVSQITQLGEVTFDYSFYKIINDTLVKISKSNNPKYMTDDSNGGKVMYDFEYYMEGLKTAFADQHEILIAGKE